MKEHTPERPGPFTIALAALAALCSAYFVYAVSVYGLLEGYIDHTEPNIAIGSWRFLEGHALFQDRDEWPIFGSYGPMVYLIHSTVFKIAGGSIPLSKLANSIASFGAVLVFFLYAKNRFGTVKAYGGVILFIALLLIFSPNSFWNRPDPFIIFLVVVSIFARNLPEERWGVWAPNVVIGVCIGVAVNLKVHSFIYFLPVAVDLCGWKGIRRMVVIGLISIAVFLLAFAHPQISLTKYIGGMFDNLSVREGFSEEMFMTSLRYSVFFLAPGFLLGGLLARGREFIDARDAVYFAALCASTFLALYPASSIGMGPYHLLPLAAVSVDAMLRFIGGFDTMGRLQKGLMAAIPVIFLMVSLPVQKRLMRNMDRIAEENAAEEVHTIAGGYEGQSIQIGYGESFENNRFSYYKPILMFAGHPVTIDAQVMMEFDFIGLDVTGKLAADFGACKTRHWLIPKGERPFRLQSYYRARPVFGKAADVFVEKYSKTQSLAYYDVWSCRD